MNVRGELKDYRDKRGNPIQISKDGKLLNLKNEFGPAWREIYRASQIDP